MLVLLQRTVLFATLAVPMNMPPKAAALLQFTSNITSVLQGAVQTYTTNSHCASIENVLPLVRLQQRPQNSQMQHSTA
jgi:hypothetical protein